MDVGPGPSYRTQLYSGATQMDTLARLTSRGLSHCVDLHLRDKLAHFHLDDGVLQVHLQQLGVHCATLAGFGPVGGEDP